MNVTRIESCDGWITRGIQQQKWFPDNVICMYIVNHESCSPLLPWLRKTWQQQGLNSRFLLASEIDIIEIEVFLETVSLEPPTVLVVTFDGEPSRKLYTRLIELGSAYQGVHRIIFMVAASQKLTVSKNSTIEVPKYVDYNLFSVLCSLINQTPQDKKTVKAFFDRVSHVAPKLTLAQACAVIPYIDVLGRNKEEFYSTWLPTLIKTTPSLFTLSQYLLARDTRSFYATWNYVYSRYPDEFWLVYWSDQFWYVYCFMTAHRTSESDRAALFTKGLPFSFTQRGWRSHKAELFAELIELIYEYDCHAKQGGFIIPYELLFNKILSDQRKD